MKVLICGGRDFYNYDLLDKVLSNLHHDTPITQVISGCAPGADSLGEKWATARAIQIARYPAQWHTFGKGAGPIRNQQMLDEGKPDKVVAFAGGTGTADMIKRSKLAGVEVLLG